MTYRGLSLLLSMSFLLLFVDADSFIKINEFWPIIIVSGFVTLAANYFGSNIYLYMPVGLAGALCTSSQTIAVTLFGFILLNESPTELQLILLCLILLFIFMLGFRNQNSAGLQTYNPKLGLISTLFFGIFSGLSIVFVGKFSREFSPLLSAYVWEASVGVCGLFVCFLRKKIFKIELKRISKKEFISLLLHCSPTIVGTACMALAVSRGPISLVYAIIAAGMVVNCILGRVIYKEELNSKQWAIILVICCLVGIIKIFS